MATRLALIFSLFSVVALAQYFPPGGGGSGGGGGQYSTASATYTTGQGTYYFPPGGGLAGQTTEAPVKTLQQVAGTIQNFAVTLSANAGSSTLAFVFRDNGVSQGVTCSITGAVNSCSDTTHSFAQSAGDLTDIQVTVTGASYTGSVIITWATPGQQGPTGATGATGPTGPQGPTVYPGAGVANSTGSAWGTSYSVATTATANALVETGAGGTIAANFVPTLNQNTTGNAATSTALAANGTNCSAQHAAEGVDASGNAEGCFVVPQLFLGSGAPGSVSGNLPGDFYSDYTNHNAYWCAATSGTSAPACTSVTSGGWTQLNGGGGSGITQLTGDVTAGPGSGSQSSTIAAAAVTLAKMANLAANSFIGNNTASPATPIALTISQAKTLLAIACGDLTNSSGGCSMSTTAGGDLGGTLPSPTVTNGSHLGANTVPNSALQNVISAATGYQINGASAATGHYLRGNGTNYVDNTIQASDVPTLNQSTTGNAATSTALASTPSQCPSGEVATGIAASGNANCVLLSAVNAQTTTYQVQAIDFQGYKTIVVASGTFTITMVASGSQPAGGEYINVINYGSGTVTLARSGQNINGGTSSLTLSAGSATAPTAAHIISDGTNYFASLSSGGITQLTGDGTAGPGSGSQAFTLATVNSGPGSCGDATHVCQVTVNGKGLVTSQSVVAITAGTGDAAATHSVSFSATPTLTGTSATAGTVDNFVIAQMSANITSVSLSTLTPGQTITIDLQQAASGGPYSVTWGSSFLGACQVSQYASAHTKSTWYINSSGVAVLSGGCTADSGPAYQTELARSGVSTPSGSTTDAQGIDTSHIPYSLDSTGKYRDMVAEISGLRQANGANSDDTAATSHNVAAPRLCSGSSSASAQTCTTTPSFTPAAGDEIIFIPGSCSGTCSASMTLNVNSSGAAGIYKWGGSTAVASGDIVSAKPFKLVYDAAGNWDVDTIGNAPSSGGGCSVSGTSTDILTDNGSGGCNSISAFQVNSGGLLTKMDGIATVGLGTPLIGWQSALSNSSATSLVTLASSPGAGDYEIHYSLDLHTPCTTGTGALTIAFGWTGNASRTFTTNSWALTSTQGASVPFSGVLPIHVVSGNVTFTPTLGTACGTGTATWDGLIDLQRVN